MFNRSSPGSGISLTSRQLQCLVEFIRMRHRGRSLPSTIDLYCFDLINRSPVYNRAAFRLESWSKCVSFVVNCALIESFYEEADFVASAKQQQIARFLSCLTLLRNKHWSYWVSVNRVLGIAVDAGFPVRIMPEATRIHQGTVAKRRSKTDD